MLRILNESDWVLDFRSFLCVVMGTDEQPTE